MERSSVLTIVLCWLLLPAASAQTPDATWSPAREGEHVSVYTRAVAGSAHVESLARTVVTSRLSSVVALIMDVENHSRWIDTIAESREIEAVSQTEVYNYSRSDAPWPVADRDAVVLTRVSQDPRTQVVSIRSIAVPDHLPHRDGVVRVPYLRSSWTLVAKPAGAVEVTYQLHNDPGGELPEWLVNSLASDQPYKTLENLRGMLAGDNPYRDAVLPYITEPGG